MRAAADKRNLAQRAEASRELVLTSSDADTFEDAVVAILVDRAMASCRLIHDRESPKTFD